MKKILFISLVVVLALSVGLIGCEGEGEGEGEDTTITVAVCGPMTDLQGQNHWDGAQMAAAAINGAGGIDVGGTTYDVEVIQVETEESTEGEDGTTGTANLNAVIGDVDFCVGGFRTEVVTVYREVAMDNGVLFMDCGAATGALQFSVVTDYEDYKYWFKSTPYNETFLVKSCLRMTATVGGTLAGTLAYIEGMINPAYVQDEYKMSNAVGGLPRVEILMEDAAWCAGMVPAAQIYLPLLGFNVTGTTLVSPTASDISAELSAIAARYPHVIFTAFSGSVGAVYSIQKNSLGIPAMTIGINVPGQQISHWANTGGTCKGEVLLDTWADGLNTTPNTHDWFEAFLSQTGRYPVYTAGTYDSIMVVCKAIDETDSLDVLDLIAWLEDPANAYTDSVSFPVVGFYPMPGYTITPGELYGLNQSQVELWYDLDSYGWAWDPNDWLCGFVSGVQQPHIAHDIVYGPGYSTGVGAQWQDVGGSGKKVGIWPMDLGSPSVDQYGDWSFEYEGTYDLYLPIGSDEPTGGMLTIPNPL